MAEIGVIHGRFQVLHLKHIEYMLAAKMHCQKLYIGITHQSDLELGISNSDKHGIRKSDNPLTYLERYEMIHDALLDFGVFLFRLPSQSISRNIHRRMQFTILVSATAGAKRSCRCSRI